MANQFDEALVERLATELLASSFSHRLSDSEIEVRKLSKPQEFEGFKADVETVLTALSETHVIVPKAEYFKTLGMVEKVCPNCGTSFWSRHGNQKYCPACDRRTVWSRKRRAQPKEATPHA